MREDRFCFLILLHIRIWKLISSWPSASHIAAYAYGLMSIVFSSGSGFSLSGWGFGAARAEIVPVWLSRLWCCNSNRSNFQRRFYSDGSGRGEKAAASTAPPLFFFVVMRWGAGWVGLELELHNGCLSELIKREKKKKRRFIPLCFWVNRDINGDGCLQCMCFQSLDTGTGTKFEIEILPLSWVFYLFGIPTVWLLKQSVITKWLFACHFMPFSLC